MYAIRERCLLFPVFCKLLRSSSSSNSTSFMGFAAYYYVVFWIPFPIIHHRWYLGHSLNISLRIEIELELEAVQF
jgi:hypothetical protein